MKKGKVLIIHFRSPFDYPPVYNLARCLAGYNMEVHLVAGMRQESSKKLEEYGVKLTEVAIEQGSGLRNYLAYFLFYLKAFLKLVRYWNVPVVYIESISAPPVFCWFLLMPFSKRKLAIHYHEYFDKGEHKKQSFLERVGRMLEPLLFRKAWWISHTNSDRLERFQKEFPAIESTKLQCMPNYPPRDWGGLVSKPVRDDAKLRLVYVGSVSLSALYLRELVEWLECKQGNIVCDVYSKYMNDQVLELINAHSNVIFYKGSLNYDDLPLVLPQYDAGLILYNGTSSSNFVYNAPNKLFEYLACGLDVWFSSDLLSSYPFVTNGIYPKVVKVNFKKIDEFDIKEATNRQSMIYSPSVFVMESVYGRFYDILLKG